jgi:hypothetical protein
MSRLLRRFDAWAFEAWIPNPGDLAIYRIGLSLFVAFQWLPNGLWLLDAPAFLFSPQIGTPSLLSGPPSAVFVVGANLGAIASAVVLLFGWRTRVASLATAGFLLAVESGTHSYEVTDHTSFLVIAPALLAFSSWGEAHSIDARRGGRRTDAARDSWLLAIFALLVGSAMFAAGFEKASTHWLDPDRHATYGHVVRTWFETGRGTPLTPWLLELDAPVFWKALDYATVGFELGFLPAVLSRRVFRLFIAFACCFHLGVYLLLDISFTKNVVVYGAFVPWSTLAVPAFVRAGCTRAARALESAAPGWIPPGAVAIGALAVALADRSPEPSLWIRIGSAALLGASAIAGAGVLLRSVGIQRMRLRSH